MFLIVVQLIGTLFVLVYLIEFYRSLTNPYYPKEGILSRSKYKYSEWRHLLFLEKMDIGLRAGVLFIGAGIVGWYVATPLVWWIPESWGKIVEGEWSDTRSSIQATLGGIIGLVSLLKLENVYRDLVRKVDSVESKYKKSAEQSLPVLVEYLEGIKSPDGLLPVRLDSSLDSAISNILEEKFSGSSLSFYHDRKAFTALYNYCDVDVVGDLTELERKKVSDELEVFIDSVKKDLERIAAN